MISRRMLHVFSLTTLVVFMMPAFVKSFHELAHRNDSHCNEQSEKHYHTEQHHCSICDFVVINGTDKTFSDQNKIFNFLRDNILAVISFKITSGSEFYLSDRAPPVFC